MLVIDFLHKKLYNILCKILPSQVGSLLGVGFIQKEEGTMDDKKIIIENIRQETGLNVTEEQLIQLTKEPVTVETNGDLRRIFHAFAAQIGEYGIHVYSYSSGIIQVLVI